MSTWDAAQYKKFERERTLPSRDLAHAIPLDAAERILDVGCGVGNSTAVVQSRFPMAKVVGADNSEAMLASARANHPDLTFIPFDASSGWGELPGGYDVIFSNACIQWVPDHPTLLRNMMNALRPGGVLAVQVPMQQEEPIHRIIEGLVRSDKWAAKIGTPRVFHTLSQSKYIDLLAEYSSDFTCWQTTYCHRLPNHQAIMEWYKGTGLRPYLAVLDAQDAAAFEAEVFAQVQSAYPPQQNGEVIFRFPRFFFTAVK